LFHGDLDTKEGITRLLDHRDDLGVLLLLPYGVGLPFFSRPVKLIFTEPQEDHGQTDRDPETV